MRQYLDQSLLSFILYSGDVYKKKLSKWSKCQVISPKDTPALSWGHIQVTLTLKCIVF